MEKILRIQVLDMLDKRDRKQGQTRLMMVLVVRVDYHSVLYVFNIERAITSMVKSSYRHTSYYMVCTHEN